MNNTFSLKQQAQEKEYSFPYHYIDLKCDEFKYLHGIAYLNYVNLVISLIEEKPSLKILDAGCGDARLCFEIKKKFPKSKVYGVDFSKNAIGFAKAFNPEVKFYTRDLRKFNINHKFDYIFLVETLEHIVPSDIDTILNNLSKNLSKNGKLVVTVPSKLLSLGDKHYQHFDKDSLEKLLSEHFKVKKIFGNGKRGFYRYVYRLLLKLGILLYPFRKILKLDKTFYVILKKYYDDNLTYCKLSNARKLIAVCSKKEINNKSSHQQIPS